MKHEQKIKSLWFLIFSDFLWPTLHCAVRIYKHGVFQNQVNIRFNNNNSISMALIFYFAWKVLYNADKIITI